MFFVFFISTISRDVSSSLRDVSFDSIDAPCSEFCLEYSWPEHKTSVAGTCKKYSYGTRSWEHVDEIQLVVKMKKQSRKWKTLNLQWEIKVAQSWCIKKANSKRVRERGRENISRELWIGFLLPFNWMLIAELVPPLNSLSAFVLSPVFNRREKIQLHFDIIQMVAVSCRLERNSWIIIRFLQFLPFDRTRQLRKINGNWLYIIFHLIDSLHSRSWWRFFPLMLHRVFFYVLSSWRRSRLQWRVNTWNEI